MVKQLIIVAVLLLIYDALKTIQYAQTILNFIILT